MKKSLLAAAALAAVSGAAQADVELYGVLDVAVGTIAHQYNGDPNFPATVNTVSKTKAPNTLTGMFNGGIQDSRWGIKGAEDIGGGLKAVFQLESGINLNYGSLNNAAQAIANNTGAATTNAANSSLNGQLFNRQAWVGLSDSKLGTLTFGRQYAPMYDIYTTYDPVQFAQLFSPLGFSGTIGGGGGASEYMRQDNSVKYANKYGDFNYGAMYKFGNVAGNNSEGSGYSFRLGYEAGRLGIQAAYESVTDAIVGGSCSGTSTAACGAYNSLTTTAPQVNVTLQNQKAWLITAKYKLTDDLTGKVGYQRITLSTPSDPTAATTAGNYYGYPINAVLIVGPSQGISILDIGGDYNLTHNLNLAVGYYVVNYDAFAAGSGSVPTGGTAWASPLTSSANINYASALLDYSFSKRTDVYGGIMTTQPGGAYSAYLNNTIYAVGMRHKF